MIDKIRESYWSPDRQVHISIYSLLFNICSALLSGGILATGLGVYGYGGWLLFVGILLMICSIQGFRSLYRAEKEWIAHNE